MKNKVQRNISIEDAKIIFRNFSGKEGQFNPAGRRNFHVLLDDEVAEELAEEGWNVKWLQPKEDGDKPIAHLPVAVSYTNYPPKIIMISGKGKAILDESTINIVDWAEIESVDLIIKPYNYEVQGKSGVKAYVKAMYITIVEDEFESKYYDVPDSAQNSMLGDD